MNSQLGIDGSEMALIENAKILVREVMAKDKKTRDNDFDLLFGVWKLQGINIPQELCDRIKNSCYAPETVSRARRVVQNEEKQLLASKNVQIGRQKQEHKFHKYFAR